MIIGPTEEVVLPPNPNLPHDYFDLIIIDECHRSIYGNWRKVLDILIRLDLLD